MRNPYTQSYSRLELQWTHRLSFWSGGNNCKSSGVTILIKGRHFTTDRVTEQVSGRVLVMDGSWSGEPIRFINVYAPPEKNDRLEMFRVLRMQLVTSRTILMGGDFNCTVELDGRTGSDSAGMDVMSRLLVEMTGEASLRDVVGSMGPNARNYSWSKPDGSMCSWIDFLFTSPTDASRAAAGEKKSDFRQLQSKVQRLFELELRGWDVDDELEETRKGLTEHFREESRKIIFRTRTENLKKDEKCNSFFFKKLHSAHTQLVELQVLEGNLQSGKEHVMGFVTHFYGELYSPKSSERSQVDSFLKGISKTLSPEEREGLNASFTLEEITWLPRPSREARPPEVMVSQWNFMSNCGT
ncbi:hypothetical protein NDU88_005427 [Pleurodeles waltl]|uniref:Endonuclease/exonuclease/phosphatase domain-containing protein n=1 Tax=Pleurodeles waltl TaxID=8319 RepID=A0AAV7WYI4_PLEWA|nr:hypothetical protein NDU88_005427 [Pleurodeles waltl]